MKGTHLIRAFLRKSYTQLYRSFPPVKKYKPDFKIVVSFVHGYKEDIKESRLPALWCIENGSKFYSYPFPRLAEDFSNTLLIGQAPKSYKRFKIQARFGLTGLASMGDFIYAGSWNGVYKIHKKTFELYNIISNSLMCDLHGIYCDEDYIYTCLTCKDTLVISDYGGRIVETMSIGKDLRVFYDKTLFQHDWRFISKQLRGSVGFYHFNYIQKFGNEIYLTSRNLGGFIVLDIKKRTARFQPISFSSPTLIHDGVKVNDKYYFTSTNSKVLIAEERDSSLYNSSLKVTEIPLGRRLNWCRGLAVKGDLILVTVDGRYHTDLPLAVRVLSKGRILGDIRFNPKRAGIRHETIYQTGFDILLET